MANPLAAFRKHQKTLLLFAAVGAMLAFGVFPVMLDWLGTGQGGGGGAIENAVVVSWNGGQLRESDMQNQRAIRAQVQAFQQEVIRKTVQRGARPRKVVVSNSLDEESIVQSILLAKEAERLGIFVSDDAVLEHLTQQLSNDTIDGNELALILEQATGRRMGQPQLFEALRRELAANQVQVLANGGALTGGVTDTALTPAESFDYFKRLYRRMEAEVVAIPVDEFVGQVSDAPPEDEVSELYEKYKNTLPSPVMPTPGFKEPMRVAFQWLKADFQTFLAREKEKLTDEEVQGYYEENRSSYRKISLPSTDDLQVPAFDDLQPDDSQDVPTFDELETDEGTSKESDEGNIDNVPGEDQATEDAGLDTSEVEPESATDDGAPQPEDLDLTPPSLSHQDDADDSTADDEDEDEEVAGSNPAQKAVAEKTEAEAIEQDTTAEETAAEASSQESEGESTGPAGQSDESVDESPSISDVETTVSSPEDEGNTADDEQEAEYYPLEEVRDDIENILARPRASEAIGRAVEEANGEMKSYFDDYMYWETTPEEEREESAPSPPDLKKMADRLGLISGDIPLITAFETADYDIGNAFDINYATGQRLSFVMLGFGPNLTKYDPQTISSGTDVDSKFVFWKVDEKQAYTPELKEARPAVERHWKMKKAIELAKQKGEGLIAKAKAAEQSLQGAFGDDDNVKVVDTGEFTWMTFGATPTGQGPPRLGFVAGVEYAGDDFMRAVSSLNPGEFTVTQNYPESTVYVVYMKGVTANREDLQNLFINEGLRLPLMQIARRESALIASDWYKALEEELKVKWARPPEQDFGR